MKKQLSKKASLPFKFKEQEIDPNMVCRKWSFIEASRRLLHILEVRLILHDLKAREFRDCLLCFINSTKGKTNHDTKWWWHDKKKRAKRKKLTMFEFFFNLPKEMKNEGFTELDKYIEHVKANEEEYTFKAPPVVEVVRERGNPGSVAKDDLILKLQDYIRTQHGRVDSAERRLREATMEFQKAYSQAALKKAKDKLEELEQRLKALQDED